jgi:hypothetical protein
VYSVLELFILEVKVRSGEMADRESNVAVASAADTATL